jgi:tetratricopeptide (TPR) repeat protein
MGRLDEALPYIEEAVRTFREVDARWEIASAVGDRGEVHRLAGNLVAAESDLRQALDLCKKLEERSLIAWTSSELIRVLLARGDRSSAQRILEDPTSWLDATDVGARSSHLLAESLVALADGDRDRALKAALEVLEVNRQEGWPNTIAERVWWIGSVFGGDVVGGEQALGDARATLEAAHWVQALREPEFATRIAAPVAP